MNNKKKSVFIYGYYGMHNFGDDMLLLTVINRLQSNNFANKYFIRSSESIQVLNNDSSIVYTNLERFILGKKSIFSKILGLIQYIKGHYKVIKQCHSIIFGGGTLLSAHKSIKSLFLISIIIFIAKNMSVKIYGIGLGVASLDSKLSKILVKYILNNCSYVGIRDNKSFAISKYITNAANLNLTSDLVFSINDWFLKINNHTNNKIIGISLTEAFIKKEFIIDEINHAIKKLSTKGYSFKFISFQEPSSNYGYSDRSVFNKLNKDENITIEYITANKESILEIYKNIDFFIGMRFHGLVLSAIYSIPFIGFSLDHKVFELSKKYSMPYINIDNISSRWIVDSVLKLNENYIDNSITNDLITLSNNNFDFLKEKI